MYITYLNPPKTRQITFDEILAGVQNVEALHYGGSNTSTMTVCRNDLTAKLRAITNVPEMIEKLAAYNVKYAALESSDIPSHYSHFEIPKKSGGWRPIDAPDETLSDALIELRELLGLRSSDFDFTLQDGTFTFTTLGYGHGVGLSQYGADYLARQGSDYRAILEHYYTGASVMEREE